MRAKINAMRKITILLLTLLFGATAYAQISYTYDLAGNRTRREVTLKSAEIQQDSALASQSVIWEETIAIELKDPALEEAFGELQVKLYPNPTQGAVFFELNHLPQGKTPQLEIWGSTGRLIGKEKITGLVTRVNLWGKPSGMYFIKTVLNGEPVTWKIIKE